MSKHFILPAGTRVSAVGRGLPKKVDLNQRHTSRDGQKWEVWQKGKKNGEARTSGGKPVLVWVPVLEWSVVYLWLDPDLRSSQSRHRPLAWYRTSDPSCFGWAPGEPHPGTSLALAELLETLPAALLLGVRFDGSGMARGNIYEGVPWQVVW